MRKRVDLPNEETVSAAWAALPAGAMFTTSGGEHVRVRSPGRQNRADGPDYLDAVLDAPIGEVRGAVEVHARTSDWERHGHGADARYSGVVLHVVGRDDGAVARSPGGAQLPLLELNPSTFNGASEAAGSVEGGLPCAQKAGATHDSDHPETRAAVYRNALTAAGDRRFEANVTRLARRLANETSANQVLFEEIAGAFGYSRNSKAMSSLAHAVPLHELLPGFDTVYGSPRAVRVEALLLGAAGLLPSARHLPARRRAGGYVDLLERIWASAGRPAVLRAYHWDHGHARPENSPVRRVVALATLALRWPSAADGGMVAELRRALRIGEIAAGTVGASPALYVEADASGSSPLALGHSPACGPSPTPRPVPNRCRLPSGTHYGRHIRALAELVLAPCPEGYWRTHWDFGVAVRGSQGGALRNRAGNETVALVGAARAADVTVNVLLPFACALARRNGDVELARVAIEIYRHHPQLAENWVTRLVRERAALQYGTPGAAAVQSARAQQGLLAVYEDTCHRLACEACPMNLTASEL